MQIHNIMLIGVKVSTNKIYAGIHWSARKRYKDDMMTLARMYIKKRVPVDFYPVSISYQFFFKKNALDTLNCAFMAKCFEDCLRELGILKDDTPQYVRESVITSKKIITKDDYLVITISPYGQANLNKPKVDELR